MRWAFWRTSAFDGPLEVDPLARSTSPPAGRADEADDRDVTPAFSGAVPDPEAHTAREQVPGLPSRGREAEPYPLDAAGVRADLLALVRSAGEADRVGSLAVLHRLTARGPDEPGVASLLALELLGDRLLVAAGRAPWDEPAGGSDAEAVRAQGQTLAHRAGPLLRAAAPDAPPDLVRSVVDGAAGAGDPEQARAGEVQDLLLVTAVLLAQSVRDEGGADELAEQLAELLPG